MALKFRLGFFAFILMSLVFLPQLQALEDFGPKKQAADESAKPGANSEEVSKSVSDAERKNIQDRMQVLASMFKGMPVPPRMDQTIILPEAREGDSAANSAEENK